MNDPDNQDLPILHRWTARKAQPVVILYVMGIFLAFMAIAYFVFHSTEAVFALATAAFGFLVPLLPMILNRIEYQITELGIRKRVLRDKNPVPFKEVCTWEELSHVVPAKHSLKFFRPMGDVRGVARFWRTHLSDRYSGEIFVEPEDRQELMSILKQRSIPTSPPD